MDTRSLALPASIVIAGALVGLGLMLGLRGRDAVPVPAPVDTGVRVAPPPEAPSVVQAARPPTPAVQAPALPAGEAPPPFVSPDVTVEIQASVNRQAAAALVRARPALRTRCFDPARAAHRAPATLRMTVHFLFDAQGRQLDFSVTDPGEDQRHELVQCIRDARVAVHLDHPPGGLVAAQLELTLP